MMFLEIFGFLSLSAIDILDILMVAVILYVLFRWIRGSSAMNIFIAIILLLIVRVIVGSLNMKLMTSLMNTLFDVGLLALIIIFQPEIRHFLIRVGGSSSWWRKMIGRLVEGRGANVAEKTVEEIAEACRVMGEQKTGALIVLQRRNSLQDIIDSGDALDADIRSSLIENIFFKNSPLHDGAMIIGGNRIIAARCTLPITDRTDIPSKYGMRHKSAVGISERSDADVIVVSEQRGTVSFVRDGIISQVNSRNQLKLMFEPPQK